MQHRRPASTRERDLARFVTATWALCAVLALGRAPAAGANPPAVGGAFSGTASADGVRRMMDAHEDGVTYLTVGNENYRQPAMPEGEGVREGIGRAERAGLAGLAGDEQGLCLAPVPG